MIELDITDEVVTEIVRCFAQIQIVVIRMDCLLKNVILYFIFYESNRHHSNQNIHKSNFQIKMAPV